MCFRNTVSLWFYTLLAWCPFSHMNFLSFPEPLSIPCNYKNWSTLFREHIILTCFLGWVLGLTGPLLWRNIEGLHPALRTSLKIWYLLRRVFGWLKNQSTDKYYSLLIRNKFTPKCGFIRTSQYYLIDTWIRITCRQRY